MKLPKIGDGIDSDMAIELCRFFDFSILVNRIAEHPERYKRWVFDGASCLPDVLFSKAFNIPHLTEIALRHDLKYAYGEKDNHDEKLEADWDFRSELLKDGCDKVIARIMFKAVRINFTKLPFAWGFAAR